MEHAEVGMKEAAFPQAFLIPAESMLNKYLNKFSFKLLAARARESFDESCNYFLSNEKHTIHLGNGFKGEQNINLPRTPMCPI